MKFQLSQGVSVMRKICIIIVDDVDYQFSDSKIFDIACNFYMVGKKAQMD